MIFDLGQQATEEILKNLPTDSGVYIYFDKNDSIIYIGKAKNIKKRVKSYWQKKDIESPHKKDLVNRINKIEIKTTKSEREALILESNLIKKHQPKYNWLSKDDKNYVFIRITKEEFPMVYITREYDLGTDRHFVFGPYVKGRELRKTFELLQKIFKFRICQNMPIKACLLYYINLCQAPCILSRLQKSKRLQKDSKRFRSTVLKQLGTSTKDFKTRYNLTIRQLKKALKGQLSEINKDMRERMKKCVEKKEFEQAAFWRDRLNDLNKFSSDNQLYFKTHNLYDTTGIKIIQKVKEKINPYKPSPVALLAQDLGLTKIPRRIEGYDISNMNHELTTGSMVVWRDGIFDTSEYRRFRIKHKKNERDDLRSHQEVMTRRLKHLPGICNQEGRQEWPVPDLILIDGGITQLNATLKILKKLRTQNSEFRIKVCSLAKKFETLYFLNENSKIKNIKIKNKPYYSILGGLRDESHRFAKNYHKLLREKSTYSV